jgi:hypothetical protein
MGLQGMINHMMQQCDFSLPEPELGAFADKIKQIARHITAAEA